MLSLFSIFFFFSFFFFWSPYVATCLGITMSKWSGKEKEKKNGMEKIRAGISLGESGNWEYIIFGNIVFGKLDIILWNRNIFLLSNQKMRTYLGFKRKKNFFRNEIYAELEYQLRLTIGTLYSVDGNYVRFCQWCSGYGFFRTCWAMCEPNGPHFVSWKSFLFVTCEPEELSLFDVWVKGAFCWWRVSRMALTLWRVSRMSFLFVTCEPNELSLCDLWTEWLSLRDVWAERAFSLWRVSQMVLTLWRVSRKSFVFVMHEPNTFLLETCELNDSIPIP